MSAFPALARQPAFSPLPIPTWASIATQDTSSRSASLKTSTRAKHVVARPAQARRTRVSRRSISTEPYRFASESSSTEQSRRSKTSKQSTQRKEGTAAKPDPDAGEIHEDLFREQLLGKVHQTTVREVGAETENGRGERSSRHDTPDADRAFVAGKNVASSVLVEEETTSSPKHSKEEDQKTFLAEQLEKRQLEKHAKKSTTRRNQSKPQKRARVMSQSHQSESGSWRDSFQAYMNEISREELLDHAEITNLATRIKESVAVEGAKQSLEDELGRRPTLPEIAKTLSIEPQLVQKRLMAGTAAKNTLVAANLRLVTSVARKVASGKGTRKTGLALDDMIQEGSVGLIRAAEKFDAARGYKFSTYATWWIRAYVMRSISTQSRSIKVPSTIVDEYARIRKEYTRLQENGVFKPRDCDVANALGITPAKLRFVVNVVTRVPASLDITLSPKGDSSNSRTLGEVVEGDDRVEERMVEEFAQKELDEALRECLKPLERAVVKLRFGLEDGQPRTLRETGLLLGLSKERIRQIIFRALPKMKTPEIQRMLTDATAR